MNTTERNNTFEALEDRRLLSTTAGFASSVRPSISKTIYVSHAGPIKSINSALAASGNNTQILFKRGETFATNGATETNSNIYIGAYGKGADPLLVGANCNSSTSAILAFKGSNVKIEGLQFDDRDSSTKFTAISTLTSHNVLINRCSGNSAIYTFVYAGKDSVGTTVKSSWAANTLEAYFVYSALGSKYVEVDRCLMTGSRREHGIRIHTDNFRITNNRIIQKPHSKYSYKSCLCIREGSNGYIANNYLTGGQVTILGPLASTTHATLKNVVYEKNYADNASQFQLFEGASGIVIRDNVILKVNGTGTVITLMTSNAARPAASGTIVDNYVSGDKLTSGDSSNLHITANQLV